jgi:hypothetical protein
MSKFTQKKKKDSVKPTNRFPHFNGVFVTETFRKYGEDKAFRELIDLDYQDFINKYPECQVLEQSYTITEIEGDLFKSTDSLAHCVSEDLRMGKGVAVGFVDNFGRVDELKAQSKKPGEVAFLDCGDRFIFYLITKFNFFNIPQYENVWKSLCEMSAICNKNGITKVSMPVIACGLDRLEWKYIKDMIEKAFKDSKVQITIYIWKK